MSIKTLRGRKMRVLRNGTAITKETNASLTINSNVESISCKDDTDELWDNNAITSRSWTCSSDSLVDNNGTNAEALLKAWIDQTDDNVPTIKVAIGTNGEVTGKALISQIDIDATIKQNVSVSTQFTGVGAFS